MNLAATPRDADMLAAMSDRELAAWLAECGARGILMLDTAYEILVGGEKVVGSRQPEIANAVDGSVVDSQFRAVVGEILAALRAHGLIAS